jgi:hypothetical protein
VELIASDYLAISSSRRTMPIAIAVRSYNSFKVDYRICQVSRYSDQPAAVLQAECLGDLPGYAHAVMIAGRVVLDR